MSERSLKACPEDAEVLGARRCGSASRSHDFVEARDVFRMQTADALVLEDRFREVDRRSVGVDGAWFALERGQPPIRPIGEADVLLRSVSPIIDRYCDLA